MSKKDQHFDKQELENSTGCEPLVAAIEYEFIGPFKIPKKFSIPKEKWTYEEIKKNLSVIEAYDRNGPEKLKSYFSYRRYIKEYILQKLPYDQNIRQVIDLTFDGIRDKNILYFFIRKAIQIILCVGLIGYLAIFNLHSELEIVWSMVIVFLLLVGTHQWLKSKIDNALVLLTSHFNSGFQKYTVDLQSYHEESLYRINQDEHEGAGKDWPERSKYHMMNAIWQPKRIEAAELYLFLKLQTTADGILRGLKGFDAWNNILNLILFYFAVTISSQFMNNVDADQVRSYAIVALPVLFVFLYIKLVRSIFNKFAVRGNKTLSKVVTKLDLLYLILFWSFLAIGFLLTVNFLMPSLFNGYKFVSIEGYVVFGFFLVSCVSFNFALALNLLNKSFDQTNWYHGSSFKLAEAIGEQVARDKRRIIEEKFRQKDFVPNHDPSGNNH